MKLKWHGLDEVIAKMGKRGERLQEAPREAMLEALLFVHSQVPPYPTPPATSSYRRTHILGNSVTALSGRALGALSRVEQLGSSTTGYIGTNIVYAPWVIDQARQAWMHRGRWWTLQAVVQKARDGILAIFNKAVGKAIK